MSLFKVTRDFLHEPRLRGVDPDSEELLSIHVKVLYEKPMMRAVFAEFYDTCMTFDNKYFKTTGGKRVEIGAGVSFFKKRYPEIVATDLKKADHLDMVVDAQNMPFESNSIRAIFGINCFHHFPNPRLFFAELDRVLLKGGGCVLIDPYYGPAASNFFKRIFESETFNPDQPEWSNSSLGLMNGANQALSYIVFKRDAAKLAKEFPNLEVVKMVPMNNYLEYLLAGGLNFRQLIPSALSPLVRLGEFTLSPLKSTLALHHAIVIQKRL